MYLPLQFYENVKLEYIPKKQPLKPLLKQIYNDDNLFYQLCADKNLFMEDYQGDIQQFSEEVRNHWRYIYEWALSENPTRSVFTAKYKSLVRNNFIHVLVANRWGKYKKVYEFDPELELLFCDVENVKIPTTMLDNLPFNSFYVQFSEHGIFSKNFHGCFVTFIKTETNYGLQFCRINHEYQTMGGFLDLILDEDINALITSDDVDWKNQKKSNPDVCADWNEFCFFILNAVLYLCAANKEVNESSSPIKIPKKWSKEELKHNRPDKINLYECGFVYGQTVRNNRLNEDKDAKKEINVEAMSSFGKKRKTPRPHPVRASWQHYWIGSGEDKKRILKFKAPYYQGGSAKYATISKVR